MSIADFSTRDPRTENEDGIRWTRRQGRRRPDHSRKCRPLSVGGVPQNQRAVFGSDDVFFCGRTNSTR